MHAAQSRNASLLDEVLSRLGALPDDLREEISETALVDTKDRVWVPNPGPQTDAMLSPADELFYGGQAGGGKSDLGIGLALTEHKRSLLLRRTNKEALGLVERIAEVIGSRNGYSGRDDVWRVFGRFVAVSGCQLEEDKQKHKGTPHDLKFFDEVSDFTESQYTFICAWNRSADPNQRCRVVAAGNPPTDPAGLWVVKRWAAWLDKRHPNPARPGELRWYTTGADGAELEVEGRGPHMIGGDLVYARSRTFIPAALSDNPDLSATDYASVLAALPAELRTAYRDGVFDVGLTDAAYQAIPTAWVLEAQQRWTSSPPEGVPMCSIAADMAQGGKDKMVFAWRHDGWFGPLVKIPGVNVPDGRTAASELIKHRRDSAPVIIDMGGGYGGSMFEHLRDNGVTVRGYKGAEASTLRTVDGQMGFFNTRSAAYWRMREALDPGQPGGSCILLPPDPSIVADLTAPTYKVTRGGIQLEPKEDVVKRLGRSPDSGDAVVMCWFDGMRIGNMRGGMFGKGGKQPAVITGRESLSARMRRAR